MSKSRKEEEIAEAGLALPDLKQPNLHGGEGIEDSRARFDSNDRTILRLQGAAWISPSLGDDA